MVQLFGMSVVAGNGDLFSQNYRICNVTKRVQACPSAVRFLDYGTGSGEALIFSNVSNEYLVFAFSNAQGLFLLVCAFHL